MKGCTDKQSVPKRGRVGSALLQDRLKAMQIRRYPDVSGY